MATPTIDIPSSMFKNLDLDDNNWYAWKQRTLAILRDCGPEEYVTGSKKTKPEAPGPLQEAWTKLEVKAHTILDSTIGQSQVMHIMGTETAREIWDQLLQVKELKGILAALSIRQIFLQAEAIEGFSMIEHIATL